MRRVDWRKRNASSITAENCGACGREFTSADLTPVKLGNLNWNLKLCKTCLNSDTADAYRDVVNILGGLKK